MFTSTTQRVTPISPIIPKVPLISLRKPSRAVSPRQGPPRGAPFPGPGRTQADQSWNSTDLNSLPLREAVCEVALPSFGYISSSSCCFTLSSHMKIRLKSPKISFLTDNSKLPFFFYEHKQVTLSIVTKVLKAEWKEKLSNKQNYIAHDSYHYQALIICQISC